MLKLIKEFKPFTIAIIIVIGLLLFQASTDLALPEYMSKIVNIGIQQNGIENSVPEVIRKSELEKIKIFLSEEDRVVVENNYEIIYMGEMEEKEYKEYKDLRAKYPLIESGRIYRLKDKDELGKLNDILPRAMLIVFGIENNPNKFGMSEGIDPFATFENLSKEQIEMVKEKAEEQISNFPETMLNQASIKYIQSEYEAIGANISKLQSNYIIYIGGIMVLISFLSMIASIGVGFISARVSTKLGRNLRQKVFTKVTRFSNGEFDDFSTASLITRSTNDIQQVQMFSMMMIRIMFFAPIMGIGGVIRALRTNTSMAWIIGVGVITILTIVIVLFATVMPKFKKLQKLVDRVNLVMREALNGLIVIRAFNTQNHEEKKFENANKDLTKTNLFVSRVMVMMMPTMMLIMNGIMLLIVWVGANEIDKGVIQVGDMMAFIQYTMQIIMSFLMISMISIILPRASVAAGRIAEILDKELSIEDPIKPKSLDKRGQGLVEFKDVSFKYPGAEKCVLENISFVARSGETTAFIGSTGSGKSTLINLIPRFYDITEGEILVDGMDIREVKLHDLREKIGYVPQRGMLFSGTIESNLRFGKNSSAEEEEVSKAIEIAQAKEFIDLKDDKIYAEISQGGTNVSGGQRQRLSIARALVKKPEVLIFDDSFSALDFKTDLGLRKAIEEGIKDSTILIVAQRINTIMNAENIIVLDEGKIVGEGKHKELLKTCDVYRQIALSQLSEEELAI